MICKKHLFLLGLLCWSFSSQAKEVSASIDLNHGAVSPVQQRIKVTKNDRVILRLTSNEIGDLHLHAYHLEAHLEPNSTHTWDFKASSTGRFPFEWHPSKSLNNNPQHHQALITLEVFPE